MMLNQHIAEYAEAQARQFDRFILFDRIKWVWWVPERKQPNKIV